MVVGPGVSTVTLLAVIPSPAFTVSVLLPMTGLANSFVPSAATATIMSIVLRGVVSVYWIEFVWSKWTPVSPSGAAVSNTSCKVPPQVCLA